MCLIFWFESPSKLSLVELKRVSTHPLSKSMKIPNDYSILIKEQKRWLWVGSAFQKKTLIILWMYIFFSYNCDWHPDCTEFHLIRFWYLHANPFWTVQCESNRFVDSKHSFQGKFIEDILYVCIYTWSNWIYLHLPTVFNMPVSELLRLNKWLSLKECWV